MEVPGRDGRCITGSGRKVLGNKTPGTAERGEGTWSRCDLQGVPGEAGFEEVRRPGNVYAKRTTPCGKKNRGQRGDLE